ncbi:MAG: hypothetical protein Kow006_12650 [Gammaproteobacteria bacterium]
MTRRLFNNGLTDEIARAEGRGRDPARKALLKSALGGIVQLIVEGLKQDGVVRLHHFGTFRLKSVAARRGRHPKTGEPIVIPAHQRVIFTPAKALQERVEPVPPRTVVVETVTATETQTPKPVTQSRVETAPLSAPAQEAERRESRRFWYGTAAVVLIAALLLTLLHQPRTPKETPATAEPALVRQTVADPASLNGKTAVVDEPTLPLSSTSHDLAAADPVPPTTSQAEPSRKETPATVAPKVSGPGSISTAASEPVPSAAPTQRTIKSHQPPVAEENAQESLTVANDPAPNTSASEVSNPPNSDPFFAERPYTVAEGDSLWRLSRRHYQDPILWPHIYRANQPTLVDPDRIYPRDRLTLPTLYGPPTRLTDEDRHRIAEGYYALYRYYESQGHPEAIYALIGARWFDPAVYEMHRPQINRQRLRIMELSPIYGDRVPELLASVFRMPR